MGRRSAGRRRPGAARPGWTGPCRPRCRRPPPDSRRWRRPRGSRAGTTRSLLCSWVAYSPCLVACLGLVSGDRPVAREGTPSAGMTRGWSGTASVSSATEPGQVDHEVELFLVGQGDVNLPRGTDRSAAHRRNWRDRSRVDSRTVGVQATKLSSFGEPLEDELDMRRNRK